MKRIALTVLAALALLAAGCGKKAAAATSLTGGDPGRGHDSIEKLGCGSCHVIPGVAGARATVGPPLDQIAKRSYLAGKLSNSPDNMVKWIRDPQSVVPGNAMPNQGISEAEARDIAAYLYTLD